MTMSSLNRCKYCLKQVSADEVDVFLCERCTSFAEMDCMRIDKPPHLKGDYLFLYECSDCSFEKKDILTRMKLSWVQVIHLALYNLTVSAAGRQGFFRWKEDICQFIEKNWTHLMPDREKTSTWSGTIAGVLSVHSKLFKSGLHYFSENGWWSLHDVKAPNPNPENYKLLKNPIPMCMTKKSELENYEDYGRGKRQRAKVKKPNTNAKSTKLEFEQYQIQDHMNGHDYIGLEKKVIKIKTEDDCENFDSGSKVINNVIVKTETNVNNNMGGLKNLFDTSEHPFKGEDTISSSLENPFRLPFLSEDMSEYNTTLFNGLTDINRVSSNDMTALCDNEVEIPVETETEDVMKDEEESEQQVVNTVPKNVTSLTVKEELDLLSKISECVNVLTTDASVRRLRRKLLVRKMKRVTNQKLFSLKEHCKSYAMKDNAKNVKLNETEEDSMKNNGSNKAKVTDVAKNAYHHPALANIHVLDRFFCFNESDVNVNNQNSVYVRLVGNPNDSICYRSIVSPYTSRVLKPYIRRDFQTLPPKLKLLQGIQKRHPDRENLQQRTFPLDYCYVQPSHVPAINALCSYFFWPGIDMTESLQYPEFSCVVMYKKLVIGFAFMVPDVKYNEAYISFILVHPDWQRAGVGTHMLYHLIQTCMGKDIILHVSPNNSSIMLYQRFGFKSEKLILNFYDKYLPTSSKACRHALLLRLQR